ncbi:MAG: exopolygalacturonase, partial [Bacteroidales bacterium]|nr:exopolygalacturonase [Bacteroidales bacterium]
MLKITITLTFLSLLCFNLSVCGSTPDTWPDGEPVGKWFSETGELDVESLGRRYVLTDVGISPDGELHTSDIQTLID